MGRDRHSRVSLFDKCFVRKNLSSRECCRGAERKKPRRFCLARVSVVRGNRRNKKGVVERGGSQGCKIFSSVCLSLSRLPTPGARLRQIDLLCKLFLYSLSSPLALSVKANEVYFSLVDLGSKKRRFSSSCRNCAKARTVSSSRSSTALPRACSVSPRKHSSIVLKKPEDETRHVVPEGRNTPMPNLPCQKLPTRAASSPLHVPAHRNTKSVSSHSSLLHPAASAAALPAPRRPEKYAFETIIHPAASTGAPSRPAYWHRGIGYDYAFADVVGENVVRKQRRMWTYLFFRKAGSGWTSDHNRRRSKSGSCHNCYSNNNEKAPTDRVLKSACTSSCRNVSRGSLAERLGATSETCCITSPQA